MMNKINKIFGSPPVQLLCRLILGGLFIYASLGKILHPDEFAKIIYDYLLFPDFTIYFIAIVLPWFEMICGFLLVSGFMVRTTSILLSVLMISFIVALSINAIRGLDISCGCFSTSGESRESLIISIVRNLVFLIPGGIIVFFHQAREKFHKGIFSLLLD